MDLTKFGEQLRALRKRAGFTQEQLINQLQQLAAVGPTEAYREINASLVSHWELAHKHSGRFWKPSRQYVIYLLRLFADQLDPGQADRWAKQAGYNLRAADLAKIFPDHQPAFTAQTQEEYEASLAKQANLPPETHLFGIQENLDILLERLTAAGAPWLVSIEGMGGIGKTALANAVIRRAELAGRFQGVAWVSAKQRAYFPGLGWQDEAAPALTVETLVGALLEQLGQGIPLAQSLQEKKIALTCLLKQTPYLVVIDNLETVVDYQALVPLLLELANPGKILLTSRHSLCVYPDIFCLTLAALNQADTFELIRYEAHLRGQTALVNATEAQLAGIYEVVGGNPLALKLVVGQTAFLPLSQVLDNLKTARGKSITDLYTFIYWQAWHILEDASQQTLLVMPMAQEGTLPQLLTLSRLEPAKLHQALAQLITLSLVQVKGDLEERRYFIHRLTETFLLTEAITWQSSA